MGEESGKTVEGLLRFIEGAPSVFHGIAKMERQLSQKGYLRLLEGDVWKIQPGGKYYVIRNGSALIAFRIPKTEPVGFQIMASHSDSPTFKIKENPEMESDGTYIRLNVEKYGGMLITPWFDRPLSVAGRLLVREEGRIATRLVSLDRDLVMLPSLAIHMDRKANDGHVFNAQKELLPLYGMGCAKGTFRKQVADAAGVKEEDIVGEDLYLYNRMKGTVWGAQEEFMSSGRLDDLECAYASLMGFLEAEEGDSIPVHCVFDNEEVGSSTRQGAASTFLLDTLVRLTEGLGYNSEKYRRMLASGFMLSADNAHAVHPNYPEKACPTNRPYMNQGVVLKYSANQRYTTDGVAAALFGEICRRAKVPVQTFFNRSDLPGGSTLGNISGNQVAVKCADIGLAQLAMHSPYETAGTEDLGMLIKAAKEFFETSVVEAGAEEYRIQKRKR